MHNSQSLIPFSVPHSTFHPQRTAGACLLSLILSIAGYICGFCQDFDAMKQNLDCQVYNYPQEKIHVMTDKPYYITGDTVWLRAFVVNAVNNQPVDASKFVYVELISPINTVDMRIKIKERDGVFKGYLPLDPTKVAEGEYTLAAYTMFMQNQGEQYFFKKKVKITSSFAIKRKIDYEFEWKNQGKDNESLKIKLRYLDTETGQPCPYNSFSYFLPNGKSNSRDADDRNMSIEIDRHHLRDGAVFVQYGNYGKYITFPSSSSTTYDVSFYPEGGYLIPNQENRMTFKAMDSNGRSIDITGDIVDGDGNKVASISTTHDGMGLATFTPQADVTYKVICQNKDLEEKTFELPQVRNDVTTLQVTHENKKVKIEARGSQQSTAVIAVQQRGNLLATGYGSVSIETETLPAGVVQAVLMNEKGRMLSERLFFVTGKQAPKAKLSSDKTVYESRELVQASVDLSEFAFVDSIDGNFAVSVTDNRSIMSDSTTSILTNLLLQSDLQGYINNPAWYFENTDRSKELDMLMMTQGWRRYDVPHALVGKGVTPQFPIEQGQTLSGTVKSNWRKKPMPGSMVKVMAPSILYADIAVTDDSGHWSINNVNFPDSTKFIVQATNAKGQNQWNLNFDTDSFLIINPLTTDVSFHKSSQPDEDLEVSYISNEKQRLQYINGVSSILLDEVVVVKRRPDNSIRRAQSFNYKYFEFLEINSYESIMQKFAGVSFQDGRPMYKQKRVVFIVDGEVITDYDDMSLGKFSFMPEFVGKGKNTDLFNQYDKRSVVNAYTLLNQVCPFNLVRDISFSGGVISITTKDEKEYGNDPDHTIKTIRPLGYQRPAEFYAPRYDTGSGGMGEGTDLRETLYWNPCIAIDGNKQARFNFYTGDATSTCYTITVEGVTTNGELIHAVKKIEKK